MAYMPEPRGSRVPPEPGYWNVTAPRLSVLPTISAELAAIQSSRNLRDIERQLQRLRSTAERAFAASRALEPRHAPLVSDLAAALQEAQEAEMRVQSTRALLESSTGFAPTPAEVAAPAFEPRIAYAPEMRARAAWAATMPALAREPPVEIRDTGKDLVLHIELPGVNREDVEVQARDTSLYVCAEPEREEAEAEQIVATERLPQRFERRIALPEQVLPGKTSATFKNGILEVTLPKKAPGEPPQKVSVK